MYLTFHIVSYVQVHLSGLFDLLQVGGRRFQVVSGFLPRLKRVFLVACRLLQQLVRLVSQKSLEPGAHRRQFTGVHGVRTPPERMWKGKGLEGEERKGEREGRKEDTP